MEMLVDRLLATNQSEAGLLAMLKVTVNGKEPNRIGILRNTIFLHFARCMRND